MSLVRYQNESDAQRVRVDFRLEYEGDVNMPTLMFFGREFETSIDTNKMTGREFRDFMDEVIRCGLREMENRQNKKVGE